MYIKQNIKVLRKKTGLSQEALASKIGMSKANVSSYERGRVVPPLDIIIKLSKLFEVSIDDLVLKNLAVEEAEGRSITADLDPLLSKVEPSDKEIIHLQRFKLAMYEKYIKENNPEWLKELGIE